jgi:hypothetical protein
MPAPAIAPRVRIIPSALGEKQFIGEEHYGRAIHVDLVAGTLEVAARPAPDYVFTSPVPNVPLATLTPLLGELLACVQEALPGASLGACGPTGFGLRLTADADLALSRGDELVSRFYWRWTGRPEATYRISRCVSCGNDILHASNKYDGNWVARGDQSPNCRGGAKHQPPASGQPYHPRRYIEGHVLQLTEDGAGRLSGACCCAGWEANTAAPDWREIGDAHFLHAEAIPPEAPFDPPETP